MSIKKDENQDLEPKKAEISQNETDKPEETDKEVVPVYKSQLEGMFQKMRDMQDELADYRKIESRVIDMLARFEPIAHNRKGEFDRIKLAKYIGKKMFTDAGINGLAEEVGIDKLKQEIDRIQLKRQENGKQLPGNV